MKLRFSGQNKVTNHVEIAENGYWYAEKNFHNGLGSIGIF